MSTPADQVEQMDAEKFFTTASTILKTNPVHGQDQEILKQLNMIGIVPGQDFDMSRFTEAEKKILNRAVKDAILKIRYSLKQLPEHKNGWVVYNTGYYGTSYLNRACIAYSGLGANLLEDAIYPSATRDNQGEILIGHNHYIIHFKPNEIPKVKGFWSITLYGTTGYLESNILNRYAISDRSPLQYNPDGSLDIYIQHDSPGAKYESNWLPAPAGLFNLSMRLYWPDEEIYEWQWLPPKIIKLFI